MPSIGSLSMVVLVAVGWPFSPAASLVASFSASASFGVAPLSSNFLSDSGWLLDWPVAGLSYGLPSRLCFLEEEDRFR